MAGMFIAIAFGRITTIATQINVVTSCHGHTALYTAIHNTQNVPRRVAQAAERVEGEKETLTASLDLDLSKDQEVLLKGYTGKKESWNGTTVIILQKLEKEEKLKVKVTKTEVKSLEDDEMVVIGALVFAYRDACAPYPSVTACAGRVRTGGVEPEQGRVGEAGGEGGSGEEAPRLQHYTAAGEPRQNGDALPDHLPAHRRSYGRANRGLFHHGSRGWSFDVQ